MRTSEKDRAHNILEACNIKLASVASDIFGASGMAMVKALIDKNEEADPRKLLNWPRESCGRKSLNSPVL
ncbi:MAG: hypothetical protein AB1556_09400 [Bacillota bacterium]